MQSPSGTPPAADDNSLTGCTDHDLTDDWSLAVTYFVDSQHEFRCAFGCVLLSNQIYLTTMYRSTIPLRSDQSALEIMVRIRVRLEVALF